MRSLRLLLLSLLSVGIFISLIAPAMAASPVGITTPGTTSYVQGQMSEEFTWRYPPGMKEQGALFIDEDEGFA